MNLVKYLFVMIVILCSSCGNCESWGDINLGGEFTLLEGDRIGDRAIIYCIGRENPEDCCSGGIPIIPSRDKSSVDYIDLVKYNDKWIIAKSVNLNKSVSYWLVDKEFDTNWEYDDGGIFYRRIQKNVYGPFNSQSFSHQLIKHNIELNFNE